jgi:integrase/recombinase XerD
MRKQAETMKQAELRRVLDFISTRRHSARNRAMLLMTHLAGMRVGEVAALRYSNVLDADGKIRSEIWLTVEQTKGSEGRAVFLSIRLQRELAVYIQAMPAKALNSKLFWTQKQGCAGFSANTLAQFFYWLYKRAGIDGASLHSGRRSFITNLAAKGVGVRVIMGLSGHKAISSVQHYIDVNDEMLRGAVELL